MKEILELLNTYSDALMVIITFVYVVFTILICIANFKSASASKNQLKESVSQYEKSKKLNMMPYLYLQNITTNANVSLVLKISSGNIVNQIDHYFVLDNVGNGIAKDISFQYDNMVEISDVKPFPIQNLRAGEQQGIKFALKITDELEKEKQYTIRLLLNYTDLLNNRYKQICEVNLITYDFFSFVFTINNFPPLELIGESK